MVAEVTSVTSPPPPPEALIVTAPVPPIGEIVIFVPAIIEVTPPPPLPLAEVKTTLPSSFIDKTFVLSSSGTERRKTSETKTLFPLPSVLTENFLFSAIFTCLNLHR